LVFHGVRFHFGCDLFPRFAVFLVPERDAQVVVLKVASMTYSVKAVEYVSVGVIDEEGGYGEPTVEVSNELDIHREVLVLLGLRFAWSGHPFLFCCYRFRAMSTPLILKLDTPTNTKYVPIHDVSSMKVETEDSKTTWKIQIYYYRRTDEMDEKEVFGWKWKGFSTKKKAEAALEKMLYGRTKLQAERDMAVELLTKRLQDRCDELFTEDE